MPVTLRQWQPADLPAFAEMNGDPEVMHYFPKPLSAQESEEMMERLRSGIESAGWGLWAVEADGELAGFTGLSVPKYSTPFTPCVEIGWRLRRKFWGRGIAYSAALQAESYAFSILNLEELVSFTARTNTKSRRLMARLRFTHDPGEDFLHPLLPDGHPLSWHVLYRKRNPGDQHKNYPGPYAIS